jgi:hypothetical protein
VRVTRAARSLQDMNIIDAPAPRPDQLPMGSSRNTWPNIVNNKVLLSVLCLCPARVRRSCLRSGVRVRARLLPPAPPRTPRMQRRVLRGGTAVGGGLERASSRRRLDQQIQACSEVTC